jgi:hypothetical protein
MSTCMKLDYPRPKTTYLLHEVYKMTPFQLSLHTDRDFLTCHSSAVRSSRSQLCCQIILTAMLSYHHIHSSVLISHSQLCCQIITLIALLSDQHGIKRETLRTSWRVFYCTECVFTFSSFEKRVVRSSLKSLIASNVWNESTNVVAGFFETDYSFKEITSYKSRFISESFLFA